MGLTREQQKAIALAEAELNLEQKKARRRMEEGAEPRGAMPFINRSIAELAALPLELIAFNSRMQGRETGPPGELTAAVKKGFEVSGAPPASPDQEPKTLPEYMGQVGGEVAPWLLGAAGGAAKLAQTPRYLSLAQQQMPTMGRQLLQSINRMNVERPTAALLAELGGVIGMGAARGIAEESDLSPTQKTLLELGGGVTGSFAGGGGVTGLLAKLGKKGLDAANRKFSLWAYVPWSEKGAKFRASRRMQELTEDPFNAIAHIEDLKGTNLLPAARTDEPGLMALEQTILKDDPARMTRISRESSDAVEKLRQSIVGSGRSRTTRAFIEAKRGRLKDALNARVAAASDEATEAVAKLGPGASVEETSLTLRNSLESALADAKLQEAMLWRAVPADTAIPTRSVINKYDALLKELSASQSEDMPAVAQNIIGTAREKNVTRTTLLEMDGLYKKLGEVSTQARAARDFNRARIAEDLRESILDDIGRAQAGPGVRQDLQTARAFSRDINEKFRKGAVGRILGYAREGGSRIAPEMTMESVIGPGGQRSVLGRRAVAKATDEDTVALESMQNYIKDRFLREATEDDRVNPAKAQTFFRRYGQLLDDFPALREQLSAARATEDALRRVTKRSDAWRTALDKPSVSTTARYLGGAVDSEVAKIMTATDPVATMGDIARVVSKDPTGEAMQGLKSGTGKWLINSITGSAVDIKGRPLLNGMRMRSMLKDDETRRALSKVYNPKELKRLDTLADILARYQKQASASGQTVDILDDVPSPLLMIPARVVGAKGGAALSSGPGASIQAAQIGSKATSNWLKRLTSAKAEQMLIDAIENEKLFTDLLKYDLRKNAAQNRTYGRTIRAWLLSGAGQRLIDEKTRAEFREEQRKPILYKPLSVR